MRSILFYFFFWCVLVCCIPISGKSQDCLKSFFIGFSNGGGELFLQDGIRTADNGFVVTGYDANTQGPVLIKVDGTGNIRWTKGYDSLNFSRSLLRTIDGNFLVTATDLFKCYLLKYNPAGGLVWAKEMMDPTGANFRVETIKELADGDLVLLMSSSDLAGGTRNYLARLSSTGNFTWKKELNYAAGIPLANSMYADSNFIYIAAEFLQVDKRACIEVAQYSLATGELGWRNKLKSATNQLSNPVLSKVGAELYVATTYGTVFENSGRVDFTPMFACLNAANGQLKNAWVFETPNLHYAPVIFTIDLTDGVYFSNTTDNKLVLAQLMREGADTALHIIKFEVDGKVIWSKKYPALRTQDVKSLQRDGDGFLLTGRTFSDYGNITTGSFLMAVDKEGNLVPGNSGSASGCISLPANVVTQQVSLQEQLSGFLPVSDLPDIDIKNFVAKERKPGFTALLGCATTAQTCSLLGIRTPAKICAGTFPSTYVAERAPDCRLPVVWSFDTLLFRQVAVTDSSITLLAQMEGLGSLTATVSDVCGSNAVSETILVQRAAGSLQLGNDTIACFPPAVKVNSGTGFSNYVWNTGATDSVLVISIPGTYQVTVTDACGRMAMDSIMISGDVNLKISLGNDIDLCKGDSVLMDAGPGFASYLWNTGSTAASIVVKGQGTYYVSGTTSNGCKASDTLVVLNVWENPVVIISGNNYLCSGETQLLTAGSFVTYLWQDGNTSSTYPATGLGTYTLRATDTRGCTASDTLVISTIKPLPANFLFDDTAICSYETIQLQANNPFSGYQWNTGAQSETIEVSTTGLYWLEVTDSDQCAGRDSINIIPKACIAGFFVPTAFTPNGDGLNDTFKPLLYGNILSYHFAIYNRWGTTVFESTDPGKGWNGALRQLKQQGNVFIWTCRYQLEGEAVKAEKGNVTLVR